MDRFFLERIARNGNLCFILDYDGTLTPIANQPSQARLKPRVRALLKDLAGMPGVKVAIMSGRSLNDLERSVGVKGLDYVGNHGLERKIQGLLEIDPFAVQLRQSISKLSDKLKWALKDMPGVLVEDKTYSVSVHYRNVAPQNISKVRRIFQKTWHDFQVKVSFRVRPGKKVWEVRPVYGCSDKGKAIGSLLRSMPAAQRKGLRMIYIGDDRTDEDAFAVLRRSDASFYVGSGVRTRAQHKLRSPKEVFDLLKQIREIRKGVRSRCA